MFPDALCDHMKLFSHAVTDRTDNAPRTDIQSKYQLSRQFHCFCHKSSPNFSSICL